MARCLTRRSVDEPRWRTLIIGYGNPLRSDDGLGWHAAQWLEQSITNSERQGIHILARHQLTPELAALIARSNRVIFIDARAADDTSSIGQVTCQPVAPDLAASPNMTHHLTPCTLLTCAHLLYNACPEAWVCSIASTAFDLGEHMSPAIQEALPTLLERVQQMVCLS
jgi:hydrogenase maturation protease